MLMPDEVRLRHARRALDDSPVPAVLVLERDAAMAGLIGTRLAPAVRLAAPLDLRYMLSSYVEGGGEMPAGTLNRRGRRSRRTHPREGPGQPTPCWLLPALLKPAEKRVLDVLFDWPGIVPDATSRTAGRLARPALRDHGRR